MTSSREVNRNDYSWMKGTAMSKLVIRVRWYFVGAFSAVFALQYLYFRMNKERFADIFWEEREKEREERNESSKVFFKFAFTEMMEGMEQNKK